MNGTAPAEPRHSMNAPMESEDPDFRLHAAWLAQVSQAANGALDKQVPKEAADRPSQSTNLLCFADHLVGQEVHLAPRPRPWRRAGPLMVTGLGCLFAMALSTVITIPPQLAVFESWRRPMDDPTTVGLGSSEPLTSVTPAMRNEAGTPKLIVEPSRGVAGEPAPIGLALRGSATDATVIIKGLPPGMELSAGSAVAGDTWQLPAKDLPYAWIGPPQDFVGSADLVAELQLPNAQIADRQTLHVEWTRPAARPGHDQEPVPITPGQENGAVSPGAPPAVQHPSDRDVIRAAPPTSVEPSQGAHGKSARTRGRSNLRPSANEGKRRAPSPP
jgi:hypothetical protein